MISHCLDTPETDLKSLQRALGRLVWIYLASRLLLATLVSSFLAVDKVNRNPSPGSLLSCKVPSDASSLISLIWRLFPEYVSRPTWETVVCIDASKLAGAVVYSPIGISECLDIIAAFVELLALRKRAHKEGVIEQFANSWNGWCQRISLFVRKLTWTTAFSHTWSRPEHTN